MAADLHHLRHHQPDLQPGCPARLAEWIRGHWQIEGLHHIRDVAYGETPPGSAPVAGRGSWPPTQPRHRGLQTGRNPQHRRCLPPPRTGRHPRTDYARTQRAITETDITPLCQSPAVPPSGQRPTARRKPAQSGRGLSPAWCGWSRTLPLGPGPTRPGKMQENAGLQMAANRTALPPNRRSESQSHRLRHGTETLTRWRSRVAPQMCHVPGISTVSSGNSRP